MESIDTTGQALVNHWKWAADKGLMNSNTAGAFRAACSQVLGAVDNWEKLDVRKINVADISLRFQNKRSKDFTPGSLDAYKRRFGQSVKLFLEYVDDPSSWKAPSQDRSTRKERKAASAPAPMPASPVFGGHQSGGADASADQLVDYPFPIREGRIAYLRLPADLKVGEVRRLNAYLSTLAVDFNPEIG